MRVRIVGWYPVMAHGLSVGAHSPTVVGCAKRMFVCMYVCM